MLRVLGQGGMGLVYLAEQDAPKRTVALKVLAPELATPQMLARFALEADALARLQHPHIAQIFASGMTDSSRGRQPFLAMEYVEGESLLEHAAARNLKDEARLELMTQLCDAVHHAHQKGVIHRDLKPANILVTPEGQLKVLDFGVARLTDADLRKTTLRTHVGDLIGTIPYMSPEQASGDSRDLDTRSDVYALGVIGYELLSGRLPYDLTQRLIHEAVEVVRNQPPERLSSISPRLRGDVETIIGKALEKEPARRYQSAFEMAEDIRRFLDSQPILARPPSVVYQMQMFARRHGLLVGSSLGMVMLLLVGVIGMSWLSWRLTQERDESQAQRRRADLARAEAEQSLVVQTAISGFLQDVFAASSPYVGN
ncbi:MAG TPA: serine/threonine-protein kinase, partial [Pirellulaceae bacterium]